MSRRTDTLASISIHVADWLASSTVAVIGLVGEAIYLRLLMHQWQSAGEGLPADEEELRALARADEKAWTKAWNKLERHFPVDPDGQRRNPRMHREWQFCLANSMRRAQNGAKGGHAKAARKAQQTGSPASPQLQQTGSPATDLLAETAPEPVAKVQQTASPSPSPSLPPPATAPSLRSVAAAGSPGGGTAAAASTATAEAAQPGVQALLDQLDPAHRAPIAAYVAALEPGRQLAFVAELAAIQNGQHGPGGKPATWWQIGAGTCAAIVGSDQRRLTPQALRGFIHREPAAPPEPTGPVVHPAGTVLDASGATVWHPGMPDAARPDAATIAAEGWQVAA